MKQTRFLTTITLAMCMALFLFSCGSGGDKSATEPAADSTAKTPADTSAAKPPEPVVAAKPSDVLVIMHKVANYAKWKPEYESHDSVRRSYGLTNYVLGRGLNDSNMVLVALKMADANKAKELTNSPAMKERMQKAGVIGKPAISFITVVWADTSTIEQKARLRVTSTVKDWDAWKKGFDDHKPARIAAGLIDRSVGYIDGDNHKVSIVFAITDMQKANAFLQSKDLKDKMAQSGVVGPPTFFFYNVVQKY